MAAPRELDLSDEVEGEMDGTTDFVFRLVGDPIPVLPPASAPLPLFDLQSPPARPLAVSDRHAAVFLAHPNGFIAARTKALIEASKEAGEKGKASTCCAQDCCVTDVPLPGVTLLALSRDQFVLAACTGSEIQFFSATSLLTDKDIKPSSSCSMGRSGTVKDFKWLDNAYIVLSNGGLLSHGSLGQGLKDIMENVDAVDCCKDGNHIAVARKNSLRILSSDLKETCCMALLFQLWPDSDSEGTDIKVDSIGWVRDDSIVVGCVRLNEESNEEGYLVQVIRSGGDTFFESSSKPVVFSYDVFGGIMDDILPSGVGPNLLLGYLHRWDLLVVTNKKSTDDHISLLKWPSRTDEERTVVYLEMVEDKYSPRIDLQENGDDNVILGFGVENVSLFQKITVLVGPEQKEVAPQHLLLCLTCEGKLIIYYLARISDPSDLPQTSLSTIEVLSLVQDSSTSSHGETSSGPVASSSENKTGEVKGLFVSETNMTGSSRPNICIPLRSIPTGQILFEIFSVETNLCLIKTIVLYDNKGATLVYKSKEGDKNRFRRRRSNWLSKHTEKTSSDFIDSLVLTGPTRSMTADAECWIIHMDVPAQSTFEAEDSELCGKIFKTTLPLNADYIDKPRCSLLSIRGGVVNISSIMFSNALRCTVRFVLDGPVDVSAKQFYVRGELTLSVEDYDAKFTIFKSQASKVIARVLSQTKVEIPLLRHVLALPVGSRVHVNGILKLRRGKVLVDKYLVLDKEIVEAEWLVVPLNEVPSPSHLKACLSIELCDFV